MLNRLAEMINCANLSTQVLRFKRNSLRVDNCDMPKRIYVRAHASVRFMGESLDPLDITLALRLPCDHSHRRGEPSLSRQRNGTVIEYQPYCAGMWSMSSERWVDSPVLDTHLRWILEQLEPHRNKVIDILHSGVRADLFCYSLGHSPDPPSLRRETVRRADAMGLKIEIDHYEIDQDVSS